MSGSASQVYTALGLMSGTSLDGIDAAFLRTNGATIDSFGPSHYRAYTEAEKTVLNSATQAALRWAFNGPPPNVFAEAAAVLHRAHMDIIEVLLSTERDWAETLDVIGFHGQTLVHLPGQTGSITQTFQLGDGAALAGHFGVDCVYDFRSADIAAGGQGAPLAPIYHKALCDYAQLSGVSAVLNLGGVGNVTVVGGGKLIASDTGPANGPLDQWMQRHGYDYDKDGAVSLSGQVDFTRIETWLAQGFFLRKPPRSADRYDFDVLPDVADMNIEDGAATLAAFCALSVSRTLSQMNVSPDHLILCGGGRHNPAIRYMLQEACGVQLFTAEDFGWDSDMIEAQAFAYLAVRHLKGLPISFPDTTGCPAPMTGGRKAEFKPG